VVANTAAASDELLAVLAERSRAEELELAVLIPADGDPEESARRLRATLARFRAAGLYVRDAVIARGDPAEAAVRSATAAGAEEVLLATSRSRLRRGPGAVADQIAAATGLPVTWVAAKPARRVRPRVHAPAARERARGGPRPLRRVLARRGAGPSPRVLAARVLAAAGLALLGLAAASAAVGDDQPPRAQPVEVGPAATPQR
jgi:hypothetical protein